MAIFHLAYAIYIPGGEYIRMQRKERDIWAKVALKHSDGHVNASDFKKMGGKGGVITNAHHNDMARRQ